MAFCDFVVKYNPETDKVHDLTERILYTLFIKRIKAHKPVVSFIGGDSGEGKSFSNLTLQLIILKLQGLALKDFVNDINVYTPLEYPEKMRGLLEEKRLKKVNIICMHEAREVIKAKMWHSFLTQSIGDINAMSRSIKRLMIFITSQFIRDITNDIRYTLNYYMIVRRPKGKKARLYINILWKDDRDLEKPKLRKRKLSGYLVYPDGTYRRFVPQYLELSKPPKEIIDIFEKQDREAKESIIKRKIDKLIKEMKADMEYGNGKVNAMVDHYSKNIDSLSVIGKQFRGQWKVHARIRSMHDLSVDEARSFEKKLNERLKEKKVIKNE